MRNSIIALIISSTSVLSYGQSIDRIAIHHIGQMNTWNKPYPVIILYDSTMNKSKKDITETFVIKDSDVIIFDRMLNKDIVETFVINDSSVFMLYGSTKRKSKKDTAENIVIKDSAVFIKTLNYFKSDYFGKGDSVCNPKDINDFSADFYEDGKLHSKVILRKVGAVFFLVNLYDYLAGDERHCTEIESMLLRF